VRGYELELSLKDLGSFVAKDYLHYFPLRRVSEGESNWVWDELGRKGVFKGFERRRLSSFFDVVQLDAPINIAMSKCYPLRQIKEYLLGHFELREDGLFVERMFDYLIANPPSGTRPYHIGTLRRHLFRHPKVRRRHKDKINKVLGVLEEGWPILDGVEGEDRTPKVRVPSPLPKKVMKNGDLSDLFCVGHYTELARWRIGHKGSVVEVEDSLVEQIKAGEKEISLEGRLRYIRQMTAGEIRKEVMAIVDIEVPLFGTEEEEVSWTAAMNYCSGGFGRKIFSLDEVSGEVNGFEVERCRDELGLVEKVAAFVNDSGASIFVAYNVPFDAIKLREAGRFAVGGEGEEPKKISTIPFFERIGVKEMDVLDLWQWAKIAFGYLVNKKLVVVARHLLGEDKFGKEIDYRQQAELERICKGMSVKQASLDVQEMLGGRKAWQVIASYVGGDVKVLEDMLDTKEFSDSVDDVAYMSQLFKIDFFLLMHDAKRIQDYLERKFFEETGVFRDVIFPRFDVFTKYETRVKNKLKRVVERSFPVGAKGRVESVSKVYLPLGKVLRDDVEWHFPELREFYDYVDKFWEDKQRSFFLARYEDALAEWMWKDYAAYLYENEKFKKMAGKLDLSELEGKCKTIAKILSSCGLEDKLHKCAIAQRDLREFGHCYGDYLEEEKLGFRRFHGLFSQWSRTRQKNRILWGAYGTGWETFEGRLGCFCEEVKDFLASCGLEVVATQNKYLYVVGDREKLFAEGCPVIPVNKIDDSYVVGRKIYYKEYGFFSGFKEEDKPTHNLSVFEMEVFGEFLDKVLAGDCEGGFERLRRGLEAFREREVPKSDLVWKTGSTGLYRAYENGEEICFYGWGDEEEYRVKVVRGEEFVMERKNNGERDYVLEPYYKKKKIVYRRRFIMGVEDFEPDWEMYERKVEQRAKGLVRSLKGNYTRKWVRSVLAGQQKLL